ncbi:MAG: DUF1156 domain-containing protein [Chloroflexi bacterium]|nr:DUF1156 domain-containing protein [Chloroflexota bacterium]
MAQPHPKRLIEVDLPIKRISAHARREKSIRHGHISTLHIWWARRPLAACRAVICAALWPDPADEHCPQSFRDAAAKALHGFAERVRSDPELARLCQDSWSRWVRTNPTSLRASEPACWPDMRYAILDFIADFASLEAGGEPAFLQTARTLTESAHQALGGDPGTRPLVADPFAGGGAIPLEALRVGADAFASDLNPVSILLNKVILEYIPKYGEQLHLEVRKWGRWIGDQAEKALVKYYPLDPDGARPIAYIWSRTITCEGPGCGAEVPLLRSLWLNKGGPQPTALRIVPDLVGRRVGFELVENANGKQVGAGTVQRGSATCPCCGFTTPVSSVRRQLKVRHGGTADSRLLCVVKTHPGKVGRSYRLATERDLRLAQSAAEELARLEEENTGQMSLVPNEPLPPQGTLGFRIQGYGMERWGDLYGRRQALALATFARLVRDAGAHAHSENQTGLAEAIQAVLACAVDREAEHLSSLCRWNSSGQKMQATFGRQALPMMWDFCEANPLGGSVGSWESILECVLIPFQTVLCLDHGGQAMSASATAHPLPDEAASAIVTDPPYYDAVPYADLSDFFYVWLKRTLPSTLLTDFSMMLTPKDAECIVDVARGKNREHYETTMAAAMGEACRILEPDGIGLVVFAHKSTGGWESQLQAMIGAGWAITGSWPIDTEMGTRLRAMDSAALASSVHLVCRRRRVSRGEVQEEFVGDWRDVLSDLPNRIRGWLPQLVSEGIVGADAIFACLGPALEIYSRYVRVEKASGEQVNLGEYLEHVWAAVSREALSLLFQDADASGLEADARLTAMWLWTLSAGQKNGTKDEPASEEPDEDEGSTAQPTSGRYALEFDAARKIAQGLGAHLDRLKHVVEVKGESARLLTAGERARYLFETDGAKAMAPKQPVLGLQADMFTDLAVAEREPTGNALGAPAPGSTTLDRVHQAMILFGAGRAEALKRFVSEGGVGNDRTFWQLAQTLSALYPSGSEEKRWVDGVLARKKSLGF